MEEKNMTIMILLNYNDSDTVCDFFRSADELTCIDKFIIVDNFSTDNSVDMIKRLTNEKIVIVESGRNGGYAYGNNVGLRYVMNRFPQTTKVVISNPDIEISNSDLQKILSALDNGYDLATGLVYQIDKERKKYHLVSNFAWNIPNYWDMITNCFLISYKFRRAVLHNSNWINYSDVDTEEFITTEAVPGCFFSANLKAFSEIGFFDEETFLFGEETILGWRFKNASKKCCVVNHTRIYHNASTSISKSPKANKRKKEYRLNSEKVYLKKYLKSNRTQIAIYTCAFRLGRIEQTICMFVLRSAKWLKSLNK